MPTLDLGRPRELGDLVGTALGLFLRHFSLFFTPALIVVAPYVLVVDGIWGASSPTARTPSRRPPPR